VAFTLPFLLSITTARKIMRLYNIVFCFAIVSVLGVASGDATEGRLRIEVFPRVSPAPAAVRVRAVVTPDASNRALQIVADSETFYRSSFVPLDGANAATITETTLKNLPGGEYEVSVILIGADGRRTVDRRQVVVTSLAMQ
jgi:hypothetical protein